MSCKFSIKMKHCFLTADEYYNQTNYLSSHIRIDHLLERMRHFNTIIVIREFIQSLQSQVDCFRNPTYSNSSVQLPHTHTPTHTNTNPPPPTANTRVSHNIAPSLFSSAHRPMPGRHEHTKQCTPSLTTIDKTVLSLRDHLPFSCTDLFWISLD